jgi:PKD repeat protein
MKKFLLSLLSVMLLSTAFGQGWRPDEMEINVTINSKEQAQTLRDLKINGDFYSSTARLFVTPHELELIKSAGFTYEVLIADLNNYYKDFWNTKDAYHSYAEIIELADSLALHFPDICHKIIYGTSMGGRQLAALKISSNAAVNESKPQVMFDGGIHGDEIGASENVIRFARDLCLNFGTDPYITNLINTREIWLYLMVNPDGRVNMVRYNNNGVDINRDWGYMWNGEGSSSGAYSQVESKTLRTCVFENQFVVHTTYHSGTEYISCPWSYRSSAPPDMAHILQLAGVYANVSGYSNIPYGQGNTGMYPINGSTKDCNYGIMGSISWSMEISMSKQPPASQIMYYYNMNRPSMLAMIEYAGYGLTGTITDASTGEAVQATIFVNNYLPTYNCPENGDYHKYVLPGTYNITVKANGYANTTVSGVVVTANNATVTDIALQPQDHQSIYRVVSSQIPNNNSADPGLTWNVIGQPDNQFYSIGKNGWMVVDMQEMIFDGPGPDIMVFEGDATPEGYTLYAGATMDGPWHSMGLGNGTTEFDFVNCSISEARYFKIQDDNNGTANVAGAGFDLDAMQALSSITGPYIIMEGYVVDDANGNNNGQLDPGETATFIITLKNVGTETALDIVGSLTCTDPYVTIMTTAPQTFGNITINGSATAQFTVSASASAPAGHTAMLHLEYEGSNLASQEKLINVIFPDYCYPSANCSFDDGFTGFSLDDISNMNNGCSNDNGIDGYGDFTSMSTELESGNSYTVSWTTGYSNQQASLWIDLNDDKIFTDNERLITNFNMANAGTVYTSNFTLPEGVLPGAKRLRIRANWQNSSSDPCSNFSYGETEDYTVVFPGSTLNAAFTSDVSQICHGNQVQYYDQSTGNPTGWEWTFYGGTPSTSIEQNPLITYEVPGNYDVSLTVTDGTNSSTSVMPWVIIYGDAETPATPTGETDLCQDNPNTTYETSNAMYATDWYWILQPGNAGVLQNNGPFAEIDWDPSFSGSAFLSVAAGNLCGQSAFSGELEIVVMPLPSAAETIIGETEVCQNEVTTYQIEEIAGATTCEWMLTPSEAGVFLGGEITCSVTWSNTFTGIATLKVRGINDCGEGSWSPELEIFVDDCTGISLDTKADKFTIYPNPNSGNFVVSGNFTNNQPVVISITDLVGSEVFRQTFTTEIIQIELEELNSGVYFLKIEDPLQPFIKKIIITR